MIYKGLKFKHYESNTIYEISKILGEYVYVSWTESGNKKKEVEYYRISAFTNFKNKIWIPLNKPSKKLSLYLF